MVLHEIILSVGSLGVDAQLCEAHVVVGVALRGLAVHFLNLYANRVNTVGMLVAAGIEAGRVDSSLLAHAITRHSLAVAHFLAIEHNGKQAVVALTVACVADDELEWEEQVTAILEARDGSILDVVRKIKPLIL